ncbi:MAG: hypothetical protein PPP56_02290 [Longimonas sp.]|uniref:hypothetical protein n=1 Tax=Longimonas sp. TaxID=2039626 RepID=UPI00334A0DE9
MRSLRYLLVAVIGVLSITGLPPASTAQSLAVDTVNEHTGNRHLQTDYVPVLIRENGTPALNRAWVAMSYVGGSWSILLRTTADDWSLARASHATFEIGASTYETPDVNTVNAERTPSMLTEENAILASRELRTLLMDASGAEVRVGSYLLDLSPLPAHYALLQEAVGH